MRLSDRTRTLLLAAVLFSLNVYLCRELFGVEYLRHMGSIEGAFIGLARYNMEHWRDLSWFPLWYDGMPYQNAYPPLLHLGVALTAIVRGISAAHAYHSVTAFIYCLGPVALFALALRISGSLWTAFAAGVIDSLVSWSAWLIPVIGRDLGNPLHPRRLQALVAYGEGPHVSSLTLIVLAALCLDLALARRRAPWFLLAALAMASVPLTSWLGAFSLTMLIVSYLLARMHSRDVAVTLAIGAAAYCLAMPWIPPSTIAAIQFNAKSLGGDFSHVYRALPLWGAGIVLVLGLIQRAIRRLERHLQFAIFFAFIISFLTLMDAWWHISIVPQPIRYHLEMDMALSLVLAFIGQAVFARRPPWVKIAAIVVLVLLMIQPVRLSRRYARDYLIQTADITQTIEWKTAHWLNENWSGERVMVPGSTSYWLTAFTGTPELAGGPDEGAPDYTIRVAIYGLYFGDAGAGSSLLWLKALGVQAVQIGGPRSAEFYKPFRNPKEFEGVLEPLWRDGDDVMYRVGQPHTSLARVVNRTDLVTRTPANGIDVEPLRLYVAALDNPEMPHADFRWTSGHSAHIVTDLRPDQVVSVQMAWHPGWHATVNGSTHPIKRDAIGLMAIEPAAAGPCTIDLSFDGGTEMKVARWLSALTALILLAAVMLS